MPANLFIGADPNQKELEDKEVVPSFISNSFIPLGWYLMFKPEDMLRRRQVYPEETMPDADMDVLDTRLLEDFQNEPVMFRTTVGMAIDRLRLFRQAFQKMPYLWSYFRIIPLIERELDAVLNPSEEEDLEELWKVKSNIRHSDKRRSHVKVKGEEKPIEVSDVLSGLNEDEAVEALSSLDSFETIELENVDDPLAELANLQEALGGNVVTSSLGELDPDDPFAALAELDNLIPEPSSEAKDDDINELGLSQSELIEAFAELEALEKEEEERRRREREQRMLFPSERPVIVDFHDLVTRLEDLGRGKVYFKVLEYFDRLLHHVMREEKRTRIILEIFQDIFRESGVNWRPTGQLAEDFMREQISTLEEKMLGLASPFVLLEVNFDLEYWTSLTLQKGDERIMYKLTMLPSEEIHLAIKNGKFEEIIPQIRSLLTATNLVKKTRIKPKDLRLPPSETNIYGFRILIKDAKGQFRPASLLNQDTDVSWEEEFKKNLQLPSVRQDWHIELTLRLDDFLDTEPYILEFKGAKNEEAAFIAFTRWIRVGQAMYWKHFGTEGTIKMLSDKLLESEDQGVAMQIFDILNQLADYGFTTATEMLSNPDILTKISTLYSV